MRSSLRPKPTSARSMQAPDATLGDAAALPGDRLAGGLASGIACDLRDVNGDGLRDLVAIAPLADVIGLADVGRAYMWAGSASLSGTLAATATFAAVIP